MPLAPVKAYAVCLHRPGIFTGRVAENVKLGDARPAAYPNGGAGLPVTGLLDTPDGQYITIHSPMLFPAR
jgi:hypothetical protein